MAPLQQFFATTGGGTSAPSVCGSVGTTGTAAVPSPASSGARAPATAAAPAVAPTETLQGAGFVEVDEVDVGGRDDNGDEDENEDDEDEAGEGEGLGAGRKAATARKKRKGKKLFNPITWLDDKELREWAVTEPAHSKLEWERLQEANQLERPAYIRCMACSIFKGHAPKDVVTKRSIGSRRIDKLRAHARHKKPIHAIYVVHINRRYVRHGCFCLFSIHYNFGLAIPLAPAPAPGLGFGCIPLFVPSGTREVHALKGGSR